jgi:exonuclease SbcC
MTRELDEAGKLLNRSADILVAHAEHQTLATDIERTKELRASSAHDLDVLERSEMATLKLRERAQQRAAQLGALLKDEHAIASAVVQIPDREQELEDAKEELQNAQAELEKLQGTQVAGKDERITGLRRGLSCLLSILSPDVGETTARETLETDDSLVESAATFPDRLNAAKGKVLAEKDFVDAQRRNLENCKTRAVRAPELARARTELDLVTAEQVELTSKLDTLNVEIESIRANLKALSTELSNQLKAQAEVEPLASMLNQLSRAEATRDALAPQLTELLARRASLEASQRNLIVPDAPESPPDLAALERAAAAAKQAEDTARGAVAVANERLESAKSRAVEIEVLRATLANVEQEQSDWTRLGLDLGRDGLQAALVDAAGPELTETANHLLHTCFGSRWTVQVSTQRLSADKKKAIEECEIRVWDAGDAEHEPREGEGRTFSGGEKCILDEAVSLALAHLARKSGLIDPDLVRDEAGSNLSPQRRVAWVEMLRRAAGIIGSKHIYIVSHFEDVNALADARIEVANRTARIV